MWEVKGGPQHPTRDRHLENRTILPTLNPSRTGLYITRSSVSINHGQNMAKDKKSLPWFSARLQRSCKASNYYGIITHMITLGEHKWMFLKKKNRYSLQWAGVNCRLIIHEPGYTSRPVSTFPMWLSIQKPSWTWIQRNHSITSANQSIPEWLQRTETYEETKKRYRN